MGGKAEKGTPKYIANKIKAKGLQKLRWYCQMCQKQCRDENGFKCHTLSESHQRQLLLFADHSTRYMDQFSKEFADGYCELLKRQYGTKRVNANKVYQDYISHRDHLHMNATRWETLTEFVKWLGREGHCTVDETEKGWFVAYIDRDPLTLARQEALARKERQEKDDQERLMEFIEKQVEKGQVPGGSNTPQFTELQRTNEDEKIVVNMKTKILPQKSALSLPASELLSKRKTGDSNESVSSKKFKDAPKKSSVLEEIFKEESKRRSHHSDKFKKKSPEPEDNWVRENIVVKIMSKLLGEKYYKKKGVVNKVVDKYGAEIVMLDSKDKLKLDQNDLETVIPGIGRKVLILSGRKQGQAGVMNALKDGGCLIKLSDGAEYLYEYHQLSKLHTE